MFDNIKSLFKISYFKIIREKRDPIDPDIKFDLKVSEDGLIQDYYRDIYTVIPITLHEAWNDSEFKNNLIINVEYKEEKREIMGSTRIIG